MSVVSRLLQMQLENGGFALWDREGPEEYWLTAYAMDFLVRASEQGYSVPVNAINKGNERLLRYLQEPGLMTVRYSDDAQAKPLCRPGIRRAGAGASAKSAARRLA